ncbi:MAG: hypothetical protein ACRDHU_03500 [Actinomycetota bacterium]
MPGTILAIAAVDAGVAKRVFGSSDAIVLGGWPGATTGHAWAGYAQFADDVATGSIPDNVRVAMYDPETGNRRRLLRGSIPAAPSRRSAPSLDPTGSSS